MSIGNLETTFMVG